MAMCRLYGMEIHVLLAATCQQLLLLVMFVMGCSETTARLRGPRSGEPRDDDGEGARLRIWRASGRRRRACASPDPASLGATTARLRGPGSFASWGFTEDCYGGNCFSETGDEDGGACSSDCSLLRRPWTRAAEAGTTRSPRSGAGGAAAAAGSSGDNPRSSCVWRCERRARLLPGNAPLARTRGHQISWALF